MKRQLLFIMGTLENGGGERSLINLLQLIDYNRYDVDLILFKERGIFLKQIPNEVNIVKGLDILHFMYNDSIKKAFDFHYLKESFIHIFGTVISKIVAKSGFCKGQYRWLHFYEKVIPKLDKKYDIAISYLEGETTYYLVDKVEAKKKISWVHTDYSKINADLSIDLKYFKKIDKIVSISDACVDILKNTFPSIADKFVCLPNLTSSKSIKFMAEQFVPSEFTKEDGIRIISIGRLVHLKGFDIAIDAARILKENKISFKWFVIGEGILKEELENMRKKYQLENNFELLGIRENPYPYLKNADIVVQPSRYEGKSMVLDEAKILCKPIVVTNYETVKDQITENEGLIVHMDAESLCKGIIKMIDEHEKYEKFLEKHNYSNENKINDYYKMMEG